MKRMAHESAFSKLVSRQQVPGVGENVSVPVQWLIDDHSAISQPPEDRAIPELGGWYYSKSRTGGIRSGRLTGFTRSGGYILERQDGAPFEADELCGEIDPPAPRLSLLERLLRFLHEISTEEVPR